MRVVGIDHDNNSSEYSGKQGEWDVSKERENGMLWSMLYRWMRWDRQIFLGRAGRKGCIRSDEYENSKILAPSKMSSLLQMPALQKK